ncbi:MAG: PAS domain S-box protein [Proteobacteria bacterium]|nr:PAS domain S-box protein [Pseudomonadota bacterium]
MNLISSLDQATQNLICPVTGLPVLRRPEWTDVPLGEGFRMTYSRIGDHILMSQPTGYATLPDLEKAVDLIRKVMSDAFPDNRKIVEIGDSSNLRGMSLAARREYVRFLKSTDQIVGLVYLGATPVFEMAIRLGIRLKLVNYPVKIARDYGEAMHLALSLLSSEGPGSPKADQAAAHLPPVTIAREEWRLDFDDFSTRFEIIDADVLHSVSTGYMTEEHVGSIEDLVREMASSLIPSDDFRYVVAGVTDLEGANRRARQKYMDLLKRWHEDRPLRLYVFYGANWFIRTAARMGAPFMPFRIGMARDWDEAWRIVSVDKARMPREEFNQISTMFADDGGVSGDLEKYSQQLLHYIGGINWEANGIDFGQDLGPDHPFKSVFDALRLIKGELDQLFVEREKSELALRASERRYRLLVETAAEGVMVAQGDYVVFANSTAEKISGWTKDELMSRPFLDFIHPDDRESVYERHTKRIQGEDVPGRNRYRIRTKDGTERWVEVNAVAIDWNGRPASLNLLTDITERKNAEEALRLSEEKFSKAFRQTPVWVVISSLEDGRYVEVNEEFLRTTGYSRAEVIGRTSIELETWPDPEDRARIVDSIRAKGTVHNVEATRRTKAGQILDTLFSSEVVSLGEETFIISVSQDITDRKQAEKERERLIGELRAALANVKTLRGLIPICSSCKKIRDDKGFWKQVEVYVREHSDAEFSHGICPDCFKRLYPDYLDEIDVSAGKE